MSSDNIENKNIVIAACYFGPKLGVGVFIENLLEYLLPLLRKHEYKVTLITNQNVIHQSPSLNIEGIDVYMPKELNSTLSSKIFFLNKFADLGRVKDAKYVLYMADAVLGTNVNNAVAVVHDLNEFAVDHKLGFVRTWFRKKMIREVVCKAVKIIVISDFVKKQLLTYFPDYPVGKRLSVIHSGVRLSTNNVELRRPQDTTDKPYFLIVGRIDPKGKKLYEALKIYEAYKKHNPEFELKIVGAVNKFCQKEASLFLTQIKKIEGIHYLNYVDDETLDNLYRNAFATIFYSQHEGFGFPLLEAFAKGCPVITNTENEVNNELSKGLDIKINPNDLDNPEMVCWSIDLVKQVDKDRLASIASEFSWEEVAQRYFELLND